jgi:hypothetical protein
VPEILVREVLEFLEARGYGDVSPVVAARGVDDVLAAQRDPS